MSRRAGPRVNRRSELGDSARAMRRVARGRYDTDLLRLGNDLKCGTMNNKGNGPRENGG